MIRTPDEPGALNALTKVILDHKANITYVDIAERREGDSTIYFELEDVHSEAAEALVGDLEALPIVRTVEQARKQAEDIIRAAAEGRDPQQAKKACREAITVAELCDAYLEAAQAGMVVTRFRRPKRPSTVRIDEGRIARHVKPLIGDIVARDLTRAAVQRMADDIGRGKTAGTF